jgi:serine/threonine protein phosphatase PrpC
MQSTDKTPISIAVTVKWRVITHKGLVRSQNEDAHYVAHCVNTESESESASRYLFAIADGLGGHQGGAIASRMALKSIKDEFANWHGEAANRFVSRALQRANQEVFIAGHSQPKLFDNMQTTLTAVTLEHGSLIIGHVGDCRLYRVRDNNIEVLTRDHTMANDLLQLHLISQEQVQQHPGRHQLTRSIGGEPVLRVDIMREQILPADTYLLCSDGLWSEITDEKIKISMQEKDINSSCEKLVGLALESGGPDNITAIIFRIETIGKQAISPFSLQTILDRVPKLLNRKSER